jgi:hypothetical protein
MFSLFARVFPQSARMNCFTLTAQHSSHLGLFLRESLSPFQGFRNYSGG